MVGLTSETCLLFSPDRLAFGPSPSACSAGGSQTPPPLLPFCGLYVRDGDAGLHSAVARSWKHTRRGINTTHILGL